MGEAQGTSKVGRREPSLTSYVFLRTSYFDSPRERPALIALLLLLAALALAAPGFFTPGNLREILMNLLPTLIVASGMTLVIALGEIDVSVGSQFALYSVLAGWLAREGVPLPMVIVVLGFAGILVGAGVGLLIARALVPSIVATLAVMVLLRESVRWSTGGEWIHNLPGNFQWFGLGGAAGQALIASSAIAIVLVLLWAMRRLAAGRAVLAVGSNREAARLAGIDPPRVVTAVFALMGALTALAAMLNAVRFLEVPANAGFGLELEAIAAVIVGGASISGGRASLTGTLVGVVLLGVIGTALTFLGVSPFWEKAVQGAIILAAVALEALGARPKPRTTRITRIGTRVPFR
jgi:rhamnose transport system permease protein